MSWTLRSSRVSRNRNTTFPLRLSPWCYRVAAPLGAKPGEMPVQLPTKYELVINLKTAKNLGLVISEQFMQHADEVIE